MAQLAFGIEHRNDDIQSNPDEVARDGLFWGFSQIRVPSETYRSQRFCRGPVTSNCRQTTLERVDCELAGRLTDHDYYGENETASAKSAIDHPSLSL